MDASMSLLTLGVRDLAVTPDFYLDGPGRAPAFEVEGTSASSRSAWDPALACGAGTR
jgi:hypothetical protein